MSRKHELIFKTDTLTMSKGILEKGDNRGFWLYDKTRGFNVAMRADTERQAFIEALEFYQKRLTTTLEEYKLLKAQVEDFIELVSPRNEWES